MRGKYMNFKDFNMRYSELNLTHQNIVLNTLMRMEHLNKHIVIKESIIQMIVDKRNQMGIGYEEFYRLLNETSKEFVPRQTYESFFRRKSIRSKILGDILQILSIPKSDINKIKNNLLMQANDFANIEWLYNSLTIRNRKAITYLTHALFMSEKHPEVFENIEDYE